MSLAELVGGDVGADVHPGTEPSAFLFHLQQAQLEMALFHLELGDAITEQATDPVGALVDHDGVTGPGLSCCAAASLAGPEPTTPTVLPDSRSGGRGRT